MIGPRVHAPQSTRHDLPVVVGEVSEPAESRHVTGSEDAGLRFERRRVHLQPAAFRLCESGSAPRLHVGTAARGHEQSVGTYRGPRLQMDDHARTLARWPHHWLFDGDTRVPDRQHDAVRLQVWPQRRARLGLLEAKEHGAGFDDVHSAAKTRKGLSKLDADGASAEDRERHRQIPRNRCLAVGPEVDGVEARNSWDSRGAAVGDHHGATRHELLVSDGDGAQVRQFPFASKEPGSSRFHRGGRPAVVEVACHPQYACRNLREVDTPLHARSGKHARTIGLGQRFP